MLIDRNFTTMSICPSAFNKTCRNAWEFDNFDDFMEWVVTNFWDFLTAFAHFFLHIPILSKGQGINHNRHIFYKIWALTDKVHDHAHWHH